MMKQCFLALFSGALLATSGTAYADNSYHLGTAVSASEISRVINSIMQAAPSGTKVSDISMSGSYMLNEGNYVTNVNLSAVKFKVKIYLGIIPIMSSNVTVALAANFANGDCRNPQVYVNTVDGTNSTVDNVIRKYLNEHLNYVVSHNIIGETSLVKYCSVRPEIPQYNVNFF